MFSKPKNHHFLCNQQVCQISHALANDSLQLEAGGIQLFMLSNLGKQSEPILATI